MNYYSDIEPFAVEWLGNLMDAKLIPQGRIDDRDIRDIQAADLAGVRRAHFFAGIGGWQLALQLAGWPEDAEVWTGSCPCQPFSAAGKGKGEADERHLWPEFRRLIAECRPPTVFGEQVASKAGREWLARVRADLEELGYAVGAADLCAAGIGAPHIRQRLFWGARLEHTDHPRHSQTRQQGQSSRRGRVPSSRCGNVGLEHAQSNGRDEGRAESDGRCTPSGCSSSGLANTKGDDGPRECRAGDGRCELPDRGYGSDGRVGDSLPQEQPARKERTAVAGAGWADFDLIPCLDGKSRRVESGSFPLAHGLPRGVDDELARLCALAGMAGDVRELRSSLKQAKRCRVGQLKGYGNAIVPQLAAEFVRAFMDL